MSTCFLGTATTTTMPTMQLFLSSPLIAQYVSFMHSMLATVTCTSGMNFLGCAKHVLMWWPSKLWRPTPQLCARPIVAAVTEGSGDMLSVTPHCSGGKQIMMYLIQQQQILLLNACGFGVLFVFACISRKWMLTCLMLECRHAQPHIACWQESPAFRFMY